MEQLALTVPNMWADHHVVAVRDLVRQIEGVATVDASARDKTLRLEYDPTNTDPASIAARLDGAGYAVGTAPAAAAPPTDKPAWGHSGGRVTTTDAIDLTMSGDHRKY
jgi:copper chaperone CopZ